LGQIAFKSDRSGKEALFIMSPDGTGVKPLSDASVYQKALDRNTLSPDGELRLRVQDNAGNLDIYIGPADEHAPSAFITTNAAADYDPAWSPRGDQIAFVSTRGGGNAIFVMTPDGRNERQLTSNIEGMDKHPSWSADSRQIVFGSERGGHRQIYVMNADGTNQINISSNPWNDWDPVWIKP
jgi:TolB protein